MLFEILNLKLTVFIWMCLTWAFTHPFLQYPYLIVLRTLYLHRRSCLVTRLNCMKAVSQIFHNRTD